MTIDFTQAKKLNDALSPNPFPFTSLKWLSLKEVKGLDKENKYNAAIELLDKWTEEKRVNREAQIEKFKNSLGQSKVFEVVMSLLVVICFITNFLNLPPASFAIKYYCNFFDTDKYSPMLIGGILTLILLLPVLLIKKIIKYNNTRNGGRT